MTAQIKATGLELNTEIKAMLKAGKKSGEIMDKIKGRALNCLLDEIYEKACLEFHHGMPHEEFEVSISFSGDDSEEDASDY